MRENRDYIMFDDVKEMNQKIFKLINDGQPMEYKSPLDGYVMSQYMDPINNQIKGIKDEI